MLPLSGKEVINFSASFLILTIPSHEFLAPPRFFINAINSPGTNQGVESLAGPFHQLDVCCPLRVVRPIYTHHPFVALTRDTEYAEADILGCLKLPQSGSPNDKTLGQMESPLWKK